MKNFILLGLAGLLILSGVSCVKELPIPGDEVEGEVLVQLENVTMIAKGFESDLVPSRTTVEYTESGTSFRWSADDIVGVFPHNNKGTQVKFPIAEGGVEGGQDAGYANFTGNGWAVMKASKYAAYYPFQPDMNLNKKAIPLDYTGQRQDGISTLGHIGKYDYMATRMTAPEKSGTINFTFSHLGALIRLIMTVPKPDTYTSLTLSCTDCSFITKGTFDISINVESAQQLTITPTEYNNEMVIGLDNFTTTTENQVVEISFLIAPVDMSGKTIQVKLEGPNSRYLTSFVRGENKPFLAGKAYRPDLPSLSGGEIVMIEPGETFNKAIKSLANGEPYLLEKKDYRIKHIVFRGSEAAVPSLPYVQVEDPDSPKSIYASWDAGTGTVTVTCSEAEMNANVNSERMFSNLINLEDINFGGLTASLTEEMDGMFSGCASLKAIDMEKLDTRSCREFIGIFSGCISVEDITPFIVTDKCISFGWAFSDCRKLKKIDTRHWNTSNVSEFGCVFDGCESLEDLDVSYIRTDHAYRLDNFFRGCKSLRELDVRHFSLENVLFLDNMFGGCSSLEVIRLGDFSTKQKVTPGVTEVFNGCSSLRELTYDVLSFPGATSYRDFFSGCENLPAVDVAGWVTSDVTSIRGMFSGCKKLTEIDLSTWNTSGVTDMTELFKNCSGLESVDLSNFNTDNVDSMQALFEGCAKLSSINWGSGFKTNKARSLAGMFSGCASMETIDVRCFNTSGVLEFQQMFKGCSKLETILWPAENGISKGFDTHYAENFESMFYGCSSLTSLDLSFFLTDSATDISEFFQDCVNLEQIDISNFTCGHVDWTDWWSSGYFLRNCAKLSSINFGSSFRWPSAWGLFDETVGHDVESIAVTCSAEMKDDLARVMDVSDPKFVWNIIQAD